MDVERVRTLLAGAFGARSVKLRASIPLDPAQAPQRPKLGKLAGRILDKLADAKPWRAKHLIREVAEGYKPATVRRELELLLEEGRIQRPRSGIYMLAGLPAPGPDEIPPLDRRRSQVPGGKSGQRILEMLVEPTLSTRLQRELKISRQGIDQLLKLLMKAKLVQRVAEPGSRKWLWMRADANVRESLREYLPSLSDGRERVLEALVPDAFHSVSEVASVTGLSKVSIHGMVQALEAQGLAVAVRLGQRRYIGITPRGLEHPARKHEAPRAAVASLSRAFGEKRIAFLEALAVLGEARTLEVTAALAGAEGEGKALMSGIIVARLLKSDFAEPVPGDAAVQRRYRLTDVGNLAAALIARDRKPPSREELERKILFYRQQRAARLQANGSMKAHKVCAGIASPAQKAIVDALIDGPLTTPALAGIIGGIISNKKSVNLMVRTLEARGMIECVGSLEAVGGRAKLWALSRKPSE